MKNLSRLIIEILMAIILLGIIFHLNRANNIQRDNITALTDSITITKNKVGELEYNKNILIADYKLLKDINSSLVNDIDNLSKYNKKHLLEINKLQIEIDFLKDSLNTELISVEDGVYVYSMETINEFRELSTKIYVESEIAPTSVYGEVISDKMFADITISKIEVDDGIQLTVSSSNPYLNIMDIQGSVIKVPKSVIVPKRFGIGLQLGAGVGLNGFTPYFGVGISYNLITF